MIDWWSAMLWGFGATLLLSGLMVASQGLGFSRMSIPFLLGTMFTPDRYKANLVGFGVHFANGWVFAFVYAFVFESLGRATWWIGGIMGVIHGLFVMAVLIPLMPNFHPRMASEQHGPETNVGLQPPGFLALNYGRRTPELALLAHLAYGVVLGAFYHLAG